MDSTKMFQNEIDNTEETIYYWLFPHNSDWLPITKEEKLATLISEYLAFLQPTLQDYIWYNEHFSLTVKRNSEYSG